MRCNIALLAAADAAGHRAARHRHLRRCCSPPWACCSSAASALVSRAAASMPCCAAEAASFHSGLQRNRVSASLSRCQLRQPGVGRAARTSGNGGRRRLEQAIYFCVPGQRALVRALGILQPGRRADLRLAPSPGCWRSSIVALAASRLKLAGRASCGWSGLTRPQSLGPTLRAFLFGIVAVVGIQFLFVGSAYPWLPAAPLPILPAPC